MIRSMTSFARAVGSAKEGYWAVEIRSVNHRYFEFSLKTPPVLGNLENQIRDLVKADLKRGKIMVAVGRDAENGRSGSLSIDEDAVSFYLSHLGKIKKRFKLAGEVTINDILKLPGIFSGEESEKDSASHWPGLKKVLSKALSEACKARELEGRKLASDIEKRLHAIDHAVKKIEHMAKGEPDRVRKKLHERVDQLMQDRAKDPDRFEREVAFLAERSDVTEEIVRMRSHLTLFHSRLKSTDEVGRELDFLCQEMNREANTMGSKSQLFEISTEVVFIKGELEKIREQVQNIE